MTRLARPVFFGAAFLGAGVCFLRLALAPKVIPPPKASVDDRFAIVKVKNGVLWVR